MRDAYWTGDELRPAFAGEFRISGQAHGSLSAAARRRQAGSSPASARQGRSMRRSTGRDAGNACPETVDNGIEDGLVDNRRPCLRPCMVSDVMDRISVQGRCATGTDSGISGHGSRYRAMQGLSPCSGSTRGDRNHMESLHGPGRGPVDYAWNILCIIACGMVAVVTALYSKKNRTRSGKEA